jgi:hypothetical protein
MKLYCEYAAKLNVEQLRYCTKILYASSKSKILTTIVSCYVFKLVLQSHLVYFDILLFKSTLSWLKMVFKINFPRNFSICIYGFLSK